MNKITTRRAIVTGLAGATAIAATGLPAGAAEPDPVFAAIEAHRTAHAKFIAAFDASAEIAITLPRHERRWFFRVDEPLPPANCTDNPEYLAAEIEHGRAFLALDDATETILQVKPVTLAGLQALLQYTSDYVREHGGDHFPDEFFAELVGFCAKALPAMTSRGV
jgi:hypothetical protein